MYWVTLDQLILDLKEIAKPRPKYEVGQEVWYVRDNQPSSFIIDSTSSAGSLLWDDTGWSIFTDKVYPCRQALIDSQLQCWLSLSEKPPTEILCSEIVERAESRREHWQQRLADSDNSNQRKACEYHQTDGNFYIKTSSGYIRKEKYPMDYPNDWLTRCNECGEYFR